MTETNYDLPAKPVEPTAWRGRRALLACGSLALALALSACGGSAKPAPRATPPTSITSAAQSTAAQSTAAQSTAASAGDLTGTWNGTAESLAGQDVIDLTVVFTQQGGMLSGSITADSVCFRGGTVTGTTNGTTVDFVAVNASQKMTFKASSSGRHLEGTYQAVTSCPNDNGTFTLTGPS